MSAAKGERKSDPTANLNQFHKQNHVLRCERAKLFGQIHKLET